MHGTTNIKKGVIYLANHVNSRLQRTK